MNPLIAQEQPSSKNDLLPTLARAYKALGNPTLCPEAMAWLASRGISSETAQGAGIYSTTRNNQVMIAFPCSYQGTIQNIRYRGITQKSFSQEPGASPCPWGLESIGSVVYITEGELDRLALLEAGFDSVISVPDGAPPENAQNLDNKFRWIELYRDVLDPVQRFVIAVDTDAPGQTLARELIQRLGPWRCEMVTSWGENCKDANDVLQAHGAKILLERAYTLTEAPVEGVTTPADLLGSLKTLYDRGPIQGLSTGWHNLDGFYRVVPGELNILTGIPNSGKSLWLDCLMFNLAKAHGWKFGILSPEMRPLEQHLGNLLEKVTEKPFYGQSRMSWQEIEANTPWIQNHFRFLDLDTPTPERIIETARGLVHRFGLQGLVIDPWNELEHHRPAGMTETENISRALSMIKRFAQRYRVAVWIVAHPTKLQKGANGLYDPPTPYDISGSANWRNKADNCLCVHRDLNDPGNPVSSVLVQKVRHRHTGKIGKVDFTFHKETATYTPFVNWVQEMSA